VLVEAKLERRGLPLVERLHDQTQRIAVQPQLRLLLRQGFVVGRRDQGRTGWIEGVGASALRGISRTSPRDLLQQRAAVLDDLPATLDGQQLGPRLVVDLLGIPQPREVRAQHPQDRRPVLGVVALDLGVAGREVGVGQGHVDGQHIAAALSVDELAQHPSPQFGGKGLPQTSGTESS
jgi:hypothetical protein